MTDDDPTSSDDPRRDEDDDTGADPDMEAAMSRALAPVVATAVNGESKSEPRLPPVPSVSIDQSTRAPRASVGDRAGTSEAAENAGADRPSNTGAGSSRAETRPEPTRPAPQPPPLPPRSEVRPAAAPQPPPLPPRSEDRPAAAKPAQPFGLSEPEAKGASMNEMSPMPAAAREAPTPAANRVYDHLVEGDDDVIGLITYSLYKKDKRDWIIAWRDRHGSEPTADQTEAFVAGQMTHAQRDRYRTAARQVLDAYASVAVEMEKPLIVRDGIAGRVEQAAEKLESSGRWFKQFPAALLGGMLATAILVGVIAVLIAFDVDIAGYLGFQ